MTFPRELCSTTSNAIPSTNPICGMAPMPRPSIDATAPNSLTHDLSFTPYTLEVRVFNDGVAYRHVIPGEENTSRAPDEYSTFFIPNDSTLWYGGLADGHYETEFVKKSISEVHAGEWAGPPLTFQLPLDAGYASITEASLVNYSGMGLEADGRRGWITVWDTGSR